jgi:TatA/E family protein of Tat protein translocase
MGIENPVHLLFLAAVALVVLGPKRLPELARAAGRGLREFRAALSGRDEDQAEDAVTAAGRDDPEHRIGSSDAPDRRPL